MTRMNSAILVSVLALFAACTDSEGVVGGTDPASSPESPGVETAEFQSKMEVYVDAVLDRDVEKLSSVLSEEMVSNGKTRGISLEGFLDRQRRALFKTFSLIEGDRPQVTVLSAAVDGDTAVVRLALGTTELKKPFYFVREGGEMRLNIAKPGFTRENRSTSNYQVHNTNSGYDPVTMECNPHNVSMASGSTHSVSCTDNCGWFSGTTFHRLGGTLYHNCDWNDWGDDVIVNWGYYDGWDCNDYC